ncbi:hypothetical protein C8Q73DRAFT_795988 [Cubamyces lactineus]|nr:hypothetical protein C8Q73DRAFT_795988 [Cubamyces lactineus]
MSANNQLHMFCAICLSLFLLDTESEAEAVATSCGHVFHRDCVEDVLKAAGEPRCHVCNEALSTDPQDLLKLYLDTEETPYDRQLVQAVRSATDFADYSRHAIAAEAECQAKLAVLRQEQEYNQKVLEALDSQWLALERLNAAATKRVGDLETQLAQARQQLQELEGPTPDN